MRTLLALLFTLTLSLTAQANSINGEQARELTWDDLMPPDYTLTLEQLFGQNVDLNALDDNSAEVVPLIEHMQQVLASAPVVESLDGVMVRIPGFVVPLSGEGQKVDRFFLVPYFGACIHTPPPPSNQIIDTHYEPGTAIESLYDAVWITGRLKIETYSHELGTAGYRLEAYRIEPYEEPLGNEAEAS